MTKQEFQIKYHNYSTDNYMDALSDALKINTIHPDLEVVPVELMGKYCLMLKEEADLIKDIYAIQK
jgi:hypothetical protein